MPMVPVNVQWELASDAAFRTIVQKGESLARPELAHSVHVEVSGLQPAHDYWYRFRAGNEVSQVGRTRTAPAAGAAVDRLRFGVCGCSHYESGYFTGYRRIAQEQFDFVTKIDHSFNPQHSAFARISKGYQDTLCDSVNGGLERFPGFGCIVNTERSPYNWAGNWRWNPGGDLDRHGARAATDRRLRLAVGLAAMVEEPAAAEHDDQEPRDSELSTYAHRLTPGRSRRPCARDRRSARRAPRGRAYRRRSSRCRARNPRAT